MTASQIHTVLLINPPGKVHLLPDGTPAHRKHCTPPLGLAYLAATLLQRGFAVNVLDVLAEGYENEYRTSDAIRYGLDESEILERVSKIKPDIIGISVLFSFLFEDVISLTRSLKKTFPDIPIILGGHHPSGQPTKVLAHETIDFVITAEADHSLPMLLEHLNRKRPLSEVPNLFYKDNGLISNTLNWDQAKVCGKDFGQFPLKAAEIPINLDELPLPAWHLFPMQAYWNSSVRIGGGDVVRERHGVMVSTRGCPHACYFCTSPLMSGYRGFRPRSLDSIVKEIHWLKSTFGVQEIAFLDDNFFIQRNRLLTLLKRIHQEFPDLFFTVPGGTEANSLDEEVIDAMAQAHFYKVQLAIEAGDQKIQNALIDKKVNVQRLPQIIELMKSRGIEVRALFMIGFPGETRDQIEKTLELAKTLDVDDFYISLVTPIPGTPLHDQCEDQGLFLDSYSEKDIRYSSAKIRLPDVSPQELEAFRRETWVKFFEEKRKRSRNLAGTTHQKFLNIQDYERAGFKKL
jgi:radical SAM superfamily enzyme YgiQ (UPF0313 family)